MLISEFSKVSGLSRDTIRFYVQLGLFKPARGVRGGRNAYQEFTQDDLKAAKTVRAGQSLGLSLKDIAQLESERRERGIGNERRLEILHKQLKLLEQRKAKLDQATAFVAAKIGWLSAGGTGSRPAFGSFECRDDG
ncbi:MerR family transcriptional regulator [Lysobacter arenosi]|uniref:MerR family transcriptional regulator n=1 Tax=Lysobacter arenosi TaxID=2795387 RepID=A0ABX7R6Y8_9GAMM|nr:MerR family transcriptional regulator [Lysobacter arenosi]QSX73878.1 MerR family transcriptional regulator [Lysobacter arenosi]